MYLSLYNMNKFIDISLLIHLSKCTERHWSHIWWAVHICTVWRWIFISHLHKLNDHNQKETVFDSTNANVHFFWWCICAIRLSLKHIIFSDGPFVQPDHHLFFFFYLLFSKGYAAYPEDMPYVKCKFAKQAFSTFSSLDLWWLPQLDCTTLKDKHLLLKVLWYNGVIIKRWTVLVLSASMQYCFNARC